MRNGREIREDWIGWENKQKAEMSRGKVKGRPEEQDKKWSEKEIEENGEARKSEKINLKKWGNEVRRGRKKRQEQKNVTGGGRGVEKFSRFAVAKAFLSQC